MKTITREEIQSLIDNKMDFVLVNALRPDSFATSASGSSPDLFKNS
ncbi:MAG: hypothetical protein Q7J16_13415 [Candidatus Cloacimonadales bacterium]|nr:hypothetical protein [Candidatus Cloacimonadales bacterium]